MEMITSEKKLNQIFSFRISFKNWNMNRASSGHRAQRRGLRPSPTVDLFAFAVSEGGGELLYHFSNDRLFKLMVARSSQKKVSDNCRFASKINELKKSEVQN